jgi:hypothetical protein
MVVVEGGGEVYQVERKHGTETSTGSQLKIKGQ